MDEWGILPHQLIAERISEFSSRTQEELQPHPTQESRFLLNYFSQQIIHSLLMNLNIQIKNTSPSHHILFPLNFFFKKNSSRKRFSEPSLSKKISHKKASFFFFLEVTPYSSDNLSYQQTTLVKKNTTSVIRLNHF